MTRPYSMDLRDRATMHDTVIHRDRRDTVQPVAPSRQ